MSDTLREQLAAYAHDAWAGWMRYLFDKLQSNADGSATIPAWAVDRWQRQAATAYADLPPSEQASDLAEADKMLTFVQAARPDAMLELLAEVARLRTQVARLEAELKRSIRTPPTDPRTELGEVIQDAWGRRWIIQQHTYHWETHTWFVSAAPFDAKQGPAQYMAESELLPAE